jgi:capsular polysaccharide transport system permease protein
MTAAFRELYRDLGVQRGVIAALMQREFVLRWGRRNLGFVWLFAEPLVFAIPVIAVWSMVRAPFEHGLPMTAFVWTGYMPLLLFRHITAGALHCIRGNATLLYHRRVTPLDICMGRLGLEALGNLASVFLSFVVFYMFGFIDWPHDYATFLLGFVYTAWWSVAIALILAALSERWELVLHIWAPIGYLYIWFSGFFFLGEWLPLKVRNIALMIDPPFHCYEMVRGGLFGPRIQSFYDLWYLTYLLVILTLIGLWLMQYVRTHLELE